MANDTINKTVSGEKLASILEERLTTDAFKQKTEAETVDSANYEEASPGRLSLGTNLLSQIGNSEILDYFKEEPTKKRLDAALFAGMYYSLAKKEEDKKKVITLLKTSSPEDLIKSLSMELSGTLTAEEKRRLLNLTLDAGLNFEEKAIKQKDFEYSKLEGKLGTGISIRSNNNYLEHRNLPGGGVLRISSEYGGLKAFIQYDDLPLKVNNYTKFESLVSIVNDIFGTKHEINLQRFMESSKEDAYALGLDERKYLTEKAAVKINFRDYFFNRPNFGDDNVRNISLISLVCGGFISGMLLIVGEPHPIPYFGSIAGLGAINLLSTIGEKDNLGIFYKPFVNAKRKKDKEKARTTKQFDKVIADYSDIMGGLGATDDFEKFKQRSEKFASSYNKLSLKFSDINKCKGFVVEYKAENLGEIYKKAYLLDESIKAKSEQQN